MPDLIIPLTFAFGAVLGSFLNVVILRSKAVAQSSPALPQKPPAGKTSGVFPVSSGVKETGVILGRSHCPRCRTILRWFELIPLLSFILQRGRCRRCSQPISIQYPLIEATIGLAMIVIITPLPTTVAGFAAAVLEVAIFSLLLILFVIDLKTFLLPDQFIGALAVAALAHVLIISHFSLLTHAGGSVIGAGSLALLWLVTRGRGIGLGDVKLMLPLGFLFGPMQTVTLLFLAFIAGGLLALGLLATRRVTMKTAIPFGPFLTGAALAFLLAPELPTALLVFF